jgi:hypothetical protein
MRKKNKPKSKSQKPPKRPEKRVRVIRRKLGREKADGICFFDGKVHVDERLRGIHLLETLIHELIHHEFPQLSEDAVERSSKSMAVTMYNDKWRRIEE